MTDEYKKGFEDAIAKAKEAINNVPVETWPEHNAFSYEPQTPSPRNARDVRQDCLEAVANLK